MKLELIADGKAPVDRLHGIGDRAQDMRPVWKRVVPWLLQDEKRRFRAQRWEPLAESTLARKARQHIDPRILHAKGTLEAALTYASADGQRIFEDADQMVFGLAPKGPAWYGVILKRGRRNMPKRNPLVLTATRRRKVREAMRDHLLGEGA